MNILGSPQISPKVHSVNKTPQQRGKPNIPQSSLCEQDSPTKEEGKREREETESVQIVKRVFDDQIEACANRSDVAKMDEIIRET